MSRFIYFLLVFMLICLTGCFNKSIKPSDDYDKMYFEVLDGKRNYYLDGKEKRINSLIKENNVKNVSYSKVELIGETGEKIPSLIVLLEGNDGFYLILTYNDGQVIASEEGYRSMIQIKDDLSALGSGGSSFTIYSDIVYTDNGPVLKNRAVYDGEYVIDGRKISSEEFDKFVKDFDDKKDLNFSKYNLNS